MSEAQTLLDNIKTSKEPNGAIDALTDAELVEVIKLAFPNDKRILMQVKQFAQPSSDSDDDIDDKSIKSSQRSILTAALKSHIRNLNTPKVETKNDNTEKSDSERIIKKYDEAIEQINDGIFHITDLNELLHLNVFTHESENVNGKEVHLYQAYTFIAYALPKLRAPSNFLNAIKEFFGESFLKNYLFTPLLNGENANTLLDIFGFIELDSPNFWERNAGLKTSIATILYGAAKAATLDITNVNTHTKSIDKSADESHVKAFKLILNSKDSPLKDVVAEFNEPREIKEKKENVLPTEKLNLKEELKEDENLYDERSVVDIKEPKEEVTSTTLDEEALKEVSQSTAVETKEIEFNHKKVEIKNPGNFAEFTQKELVELKHDVASISKMDNNTLYSNFRTILLGEKAPESYADVSEENKADVDKKLNGLRFKTATALRYLESTLTSHKIDTFYHRYSTNTPTDCGLTIEQILAVLSWSAKDTKNFRRKPGQELSLQDCALIATNNIYYIINQIYDANRGYNIEIAPATDDPLTDEFPPIDNPGVDKHRCIGGSKNSLAQTLEATHIAYTVRVLGYNNLLLKIQIAFQEILCKKEVIAAILNKDDDKIQKDLATWKLTGAISGKLLEIVLAEFRTYYLGSIEDEFFPYINTDIEPEYHRDLREADIDTAIKTATRLPIPEELERELSSKHQFQNASELSSAMNTHNLALLRLDVQKQRYAPTYTDMYAAVEGFEPILIEGSAVNLAHFARYLGPTAAALDLTDTASGYEMTLADYAKLSKNDLEFFKLHEDSFKQFFNGKPSSNFAIVLRQVVENNHASLFEFLVTAKFKNGKYEAVEAFKKDYTISAERRLIEFAITHDLDRALGVIIDSFQSNCFYGFRGVENPCDTALNKRSFKCLGLLIERNLVYFHNAKIPFLPVFLLKKYIKKLDADDPLRKVLIEHHLVDEPLVESPEKPKALKELIQLAKEEGLQNSVNLALVGLCNASFGTPSIKKGFLEVLFAGDADVWFQSNRRHPIGYNALQAECIESQNPDVINALVASSKDPKKYVNTPNASGATPIQIALKSRNIQTAAVSALLEHGAEVTQKTLELAMNNASVDAELFSKLLKKAAEDNVAVDLVKLVGSAVEAAGFNSTNKLKALLTKSVDDENALKELSSTLDNLFSSDAAIERDVAVLKVLLEYPQIKKLFTAKHLENLLKLSDASANMALVVFVENGVYVDAETLGKVLEKGPDLDTAAFMIIMGIQLNCEIFIQTLILAGRSALVATCLVAPNFQAAVTAEHVLTALTAGKDLARLAKLVTHCQSATADEAKAVWDAACASKAEGINIFIKALLDNNAFKKALTFNHLNTALAVQGPNAGVLIDMLRACPGNIDASTAATMLNIACNSTREVVENFLQTLILDNRFRSRVTTSNFVDALNKGKSAATLTSLLSCIGNEKKFAAHSIPEILNYVFVSKLPEMHTLLGILLKRDEFKAEIQKQNNPIVANVFQELSIGGGQYARNFVEVLIDNGANLTNTLFARRDPLVILFDKGEIALAVKALEQGAACTSTNLERIIYILNRTDVEFGVRVAFCKWLIKRPNLGRNEVAHLLKTAERLENPRPGAGLGASVDNKAEVLNSFFDALSMQPYPITYIMDSVAIYGSSRNYSIAVIKKLVKEKKVDVNKPSNCGVTPLNLALARDDFALANTLVELGASVSFANRYIIFKHNCNKSLTGTNFKLAVGVAGLALVVGAGLYSSENFQKNCFSVLKARLEPIAHKIIETVLEVATKCKAAFIA